MCAACSCVPDDYCCLLLPLSCWCKLWSLRTVEGRLTGRRVGFAVWACSDKPPSAAADDYRSVMCGDRRGCRWLLLLTGSCRLLLLPLPLPPMPPLMCRSCGSRRCCCLLPPPPLLLSASAAAC